LSKGRNSSHRTGATGPGRGKGKLSMTRREAHIEDDTKAKEGKLKRQRRGKFFKCERKTTLGHAVGSQGVLRSKVYGKEIQEKKLQNKEKKKKKKKNRKGKRESRTESRLDRLRGTSSRRDQRSKDLEECDGLKGGLKVCMEKKDTDFRGKKESGGRPNLRNKRKTWAANEERL